MKQVFLSSFCILTLAFHTVLPSTAYSLEYYDESPSEVAELEGNQCYSFEALPQGIVLNGKTLLERRRENLTAKLSQHSIQESGLRSFITNAASEAAATTLSLGINFLVHSLKERVARHFSMENSVASQTGDMILTQMVASSVGQSVSGVRNSFQELGGSSTRMKLRALRQVHAELVQESEHEDRALPEDIQIQIRRLDEAFSRELTVAEPRADFLSTLVDRRELILRSIPSHPKNIAHYDKNGDPKIRAEIDGRVNSLVHEYSGENREVIRSLIQKIRDSSIFSRSDRAQAYLYGPPGTGKTRFVRRLAEVLGLPLCEISFKDSKEEDILGRNFDALLNLSEKDIAVTGKLGRCFLEAGTMNPILFFDEAGETLSKVGLNSNGALKSFLKDLLDPEKREVLFRGMGITLDFSRVTIIFAGNEQMEDAALRSKLPSIYFGQLDYEQKNAAVNDALRKYLLELKEVFSAEDVEAIRLEFEKHREFLIQADSAANPGARILIAVVLDTLNFIRIHLLNHEAIEEFQIRKMIESSLAQRGPVKP